MAEKDTKKDKALRALSGVSEGVRTQGIPGLAGLALIPLMPKLRSMAYASKDLPEQFQTNTSDKLLSLMERLMASTGYVSPKGRELGFKEMSDPGNAKFIPELLVKEKLPKFLQKLFDENKVPKFIRDKFVEGRLPQDVVQLGVGAAPQTVAHEIGHAAAGSLPSRILRNTSLIVRTPAITMTPSLLALSGALSPNEELPAYAKAAPYVGAGILATILAEEARANIVGIKALEAIGKQMPVSDKLKMFLPTATYLGKAGLLVGAPAAILKGIEAYKKSKQKGRELTPLQIAGTLPSTLANQPTSQELAEKWREKLHK